MIACGPRDSMPVPTAARLQSMLKDNLVRPRASQLTDKAASPTRNHHAEHNFFMQDHVLCLFKIGYFIQLAWEPTNCL
jgi:hypothetical protein